MAFERIGVRAVIEGVSAFNRDAQIINRRLQEVTGNVDRSAQATEEAAKDFSDLAGELALVGAAFAAVGAVTGAFLYSSVRLAARVETLGVVTARLGQNVGYTEGQIRELEQAVVSQGITLQGSRQAIALMIQSNIDLAFATKLAREAQDAAVIANINSTEAFQRLVFVITSGNVRMARTLGLQVSFQNAYEATAAALGKTTLELTEQEKVAARTNAVIEAGANIVGAYEAAMTTAGKKVLSLERFQEEANRIFGEQFLPIMAAVVDLLTAALSAYSDLPAPIRNIIGSMVLLVATTGTLGGALALTSAAAIKLGPAFAAVATAAGLTVAQFGILVLAIGAVVAAGVLLVNTINDIQLKQKQLKDITTEHAQATLRAADSATEYNREAQRVNDVIEQQGILGRALAGGMKLLSEEEFNAAKAALALQDRMQGVGEATDTNLDAIDELADRLSVSRQRFLDLADAAGVALDNLEELPDLKGIELQVRAELEKQTQERLQRELSDLQFTIDTDISVQLGDTQEKLEELRGQLGELIGESVEAAAQIKVEGVEDLEAARDSLAGLNDQRKDAVTRLGEMETELQIAKLRLKEMNDETDKATRLAAEARIDRLTTDIADQREQISEIGGEIREWNAAIAAAPEEQAAKLAELQQEYTDKKGAIVAQIDEVTEAWRRQTKEIIFNLATQRLGLGGFTDEELDVLTKLAGPEGLGLIDEGAVALLESMDKLNQALALPGDQAPIVADALGKMSSAMADPTTDAEHLAAAIRDIAAAAEELAKAPFPTPRFETDPFARNFERRQGGGPVRAGRPYVVGERQPELFVPKQGGNIIPDLMSLISRAFPAIAPPSLAMAGAGATTNNNFSQTINTSAPREPIAADFNLLALRAGRR